MHERLSFYVKRDSALHRLNPLTKIILALSIILISIISPWYWTSVVLLLAVIVPLSFAGKVSKEYFSSAIKVILPAAGFIFLMQAFFQPVGETVIFQFWFLDVTRESLLYAFRISTRIAVMISAFTLLLLTTHPSELMSDLTRRGLPGQFAYVIISTLQILPQMQAKAQTIIAAQRSRGLDTESSFLKRIGSLVPWLGRWFLVPLQKWRSVPSPSKLAASHPKKSKHPCMKSLTVVWIGLSAGVLSFLLSFPLR